MGNRQTINAFYHTKIQRRRGKTKDIDYQTLSFIKQEDKRSVYLSIILQAKGLFVR